MIFKSAYSEKPRNGLVFLDDEGNPLPGRTKQSFKAETDINRILAQYDRTGLITHVNRAVADYGDYTEINEYQESMNMVIKAQDAFAALPSAIRSRFANDPGKFLEFASNPANLDSMVEMGLAIRPAAPEVPPAPIVEA